MVALLTMQLNTVIILNSCFCKEKWIARHKEQTRLSPGCKKNEEKGTKHGRKWFAPLYLLVLTVIRENMEFLIVNHYFGITFYSLKYETSTMMYRIFFVSTKWLWHFKKQSLTVTPLQRHPLQRSLIVGVPKKYSQKGLLRCTHVNNTSTIRRPNLTVK